MLYYKALNLCEVLSKYLKRLPTYRADTSTWKKYLRCSKDRNFSGRLTRVIVLVFCTSYHGDIHLHKVSRQYLKQFSSYRNHYFLCSKGHYSKSKISKVRVLKFCSSSYDALHFCGFIKISKRFLTYRAETST